jgi:hypothetical protein
MRTIRIALDKYTAHAKAVLAAVLVTASLLAWAAGPLLVSDVHSTDGISLTNIAASVALTGTALQSAISATGQVLSAAIQSTGLQLRASIASTGSLLGAKIDSARELLLEWATRTRVDDPTALDNIDFATIVNTNMMLLDYSLYTTNQQAWINQYVFHDQSNGWVYVDGTQVIRLINAETGEAGRWWYGDEEEFLGYGTIRFDLGAPAYDEGTFTTYWDPTPSYGVLTPVDIFLFRLIIGRPRFRWWGQ